MARTTKKQAEVPAVATRAEKKDATKKLIRELLAVKPYKHNELIEETAKLYTERFGGEETDNVNDVKGRVGSVLDIMKKESDVIYDGGMYALKARLPMPEPTPKAVEAAAEAETKTTKKTAKAKAKKTEAVEAEKPAETEEKPTKKPTKKSKAKAAETAAETPKAEEEKPVKKKASVKAKKTEEPKSETVKAKEVKEEKSVKKSARTKAKKAEEPKTEEKAETAVQEEKKPVEEVKIEQKTEEKPVEKTAKADEKTEIKNPPAIKEKAEIAKKNVVMDMSFLFGAKQPTKIEPKAEVKAEAKPATAPSPKTEQKTPVAPTLKAEQKPAVTSKAEQKAPSVPTPKAETPKKEQKAAPVKAKNVRKVENKPLTADERLCEGFLKRMRTLGGDYFEYYAVYLLERYSMKNGRRLESMRISGGDRDGGIDGEIELTDKFGFKETIYVQAKNWDPDKGDERLWVVGETLLQQFIGACACKQAKDGKQHSRGIFVTTSRFTPDAKRILETMSDKIIGYDGKDLYEAAKECEFGVVKRGNEWILDEKLLSGPKAFFNMY